MAALTAESGARLAAFAGLFVYFLVKTHNQIAAFSRNHTVITKRTESRSPLEFPALTLCPGLKQDVAEDLGWPNMVENTGALPEKYPPTKEDAENQWAAVTYSKEEIILNATDEDPFTVAERDTVGGRCFTVLKRDGAAAAGDRISVKVNLTAMSASGSGSIFVHDRAAIMGLNGNFWTGNMSMATVRARDVTGTALDLVIFKSVAIRLPGTGTEVSADEYHAAVNEWFYRKFVESGACWSPMFISAVNYTGTYCADYKAFQGAIIRFFSLLDEQMTGESGIPQPRELPSYRVRKQDIFSSREAAETTIYFFYESLSVSVEEEVPLLDLDGLVANIGGWLGLLVGASCYGAMADIIALCAHVAKRATT